MCDPAAPTVWEVDPDRRSGAAGYEVIDPETDTRRDYAAIYDSDENSKSETEDELEKQWTLG